MRKTSEMEVQIEARFCATARSRKLKKISGISPIMTSALVASIGVESILRMAAKYRLCKKY